MRRGLGSSSQAVEEPAKKCLLSNKGVEQEGSEGSADSWSLWEVLVKRWEDFTGLWTSGLSFFGHDYFWTLEPNLSKTTRFGGKVFVPANSTCKGRVGGELFIGFFSSMMGESGEEQILKQGLAEEIEFNS
jgi:hypothetical protein